MKIVAGLLSVSMLGVLAVGCGGSDDEGLSDAEVAAMETRFAKPDGTLSGGNAAAVLSGAKDNQSSASGANVTGNGSATGSSSTTVAKKSLDLVPMAIAPLTSSNPFVCSALQSGSQSGSCACPSGGDFSYAIRGAGGGGSGNTVMRIKMNACASGTTVIDGSEFLSIQSDTSDQRNPKFSMLFVIDATVTSDGKTKKVDAQMRYSNGGYEVAVRVDDGWVIVGSKTAGGVTTTVVRDRNGSWTCVYESAKGQCTSDKGEKVSWGA